MDWTHLPVLLATLRMFSLIQFTSHPGEFGDVWGWAFGGFGPGGLGPRVWSLGWCLVVWVWVRGPPLLIHARMLAHTKCLRFCGLLVEISGCRAVPDAKPHALEEASEHLPPFPGEILCKKPQNFSGANTKLDGRIMPKKPSHPLPPHKDDKRMTVQARSAGSGPCCEISGSGVPNLRSRPFRSGEGSQG